MITSYVLRLICICLASFFVIHFIAGSAVSIAAPAIIRWTQRINPRRAVSFLLAARFLPVGVSFILVGLLCIPSYLLLEPKESSEEGLSVICIVAAVLCVLVWMISIRRGASAVIRSLRYDRECLTMGRAARFKEEALPALLIEASVPVIAMSGVFHPRLVISRRIVEELGPEQLSVALLHEHAHYNSRDNLKRLLMFLAPGLLPFCRGFDDFELAWSRLAEWAADDLAVAGDFDRSVALASAMVRVARMGAPVQPPPLCTSLVPEVAELATRVDRLLTGCSVRDDRSMSLVVIGAAFAGSALIVALLSYPITVLQSVHSLLENLTR
jgi:beta-lactamase regulating signal transducer with metallopeptidase domain